MLACAGLLVMGLANRLPWPKVEAVRVSVDTSGYQRVTELQIDGHEIAEMSLLFEESAVVSPGRHVLTGVFDGHHASLPFNAEYEPGSGIHHMLVRGIPPKLDGMTGYP